jgi:hypothetical protein
MKANLKKIATLVKRVMPLALAVTVGLSSCSTEEVFNGNDGNGGNSLVDDRGDGEVKSVRLKLSGKLPSTRAESGSVVTGTSVAFNGGFLLFASEQYNITKVMAITLNPNTLTDTEVDITSLIDGADIQNVPGHSKYAYVLGNVPAEISAPQVGESLSALKDKAVLCASQSNISGVVLFGGEEITLVNALYEAKFDLAPVVSRIEIGKIEADASGDIKSFEVDGIFINNYYGEISLGGKVTSAAVKHAQTSDFVYPGSPVYTSGLKGILFDYREDATAGLGVTPDSMSYTTSVSGNVWAYNLLAPRIPESGGSFATPHIVVRLNNIQTKSGIAYKDPWYLTVSGLKVGSNKVARLEPGKIYSIRNIKFLHSNIQPEPEMKTMDVSVDVTLVEWEVFDTDVIFGQE